MSSPCKLVGCKEGMFAREKVHTLSACPSEFLPPHTDEREKENKSQRHCMIKLKKSHTSHFSLLVATRSLAPQT